MQSIKASSVPIRKVKWLWEPYIPMGMLTLVAGVPGEGKSLFTCWLAAMVSKNRKVLISNSEDDYSLVVRPRLEAAGAKMQNISFMNPVPVLPRDIPRLLQEIDRHHIGLVILDPLQDHLELSIFSPKTTHTLAPISKEIAARDVAFVSISHTIKSLSKGAHPLYAVGGTAGGLARVMRMVHLFGANPNDTSQRILAPTKANFLPESAKVSIAFETVQKELRRNGTVIRPGLLNMVGEAADVTAAMIVRPSKGGDDLPHHGDRRLQAAQWLKARLEVAPGHQLPVKQLQREAEQSELSWMTIRRADEAIVHTKKVRIGQKGRVGGNAVFWQLPPEGGA